MIINQNINQVKQKAPSIETLWLNVVINDPGYWIKQFRAMQSMDIKSILINPRFTMAQKLNKIFGHKYRELFPNADKMSLSIKVLGDIFSDIGNWFNKTFSSGNLSQIEQGIRKGNNVTNQIADFLNYIRNQGGLQSQVEKEQKIKDVQTQFFQRGSSIWQTYQLPIMIGGGLLMFALLLKKK